MTRKMLIDATHAEETRVVVVDGNKVEEFDFESLNKRQLAGNIYLAKVTRVEPSLQAAFIEYGGNRHGFLAFSEIHPDYYQIPKADREALLAEEAEYARQPDEDAPAEKPKARGRSRSRSRSKATAEGAAATEDAVIASDGLPESEPSGGAARDRRRRVRGRAAALRRQRRDRHRCRRGTRRPFRGFGRRIRGRRRRRSRRGTQPGPQAAPAPLQDPGSDQGPPDPAGAGRQGGARQQGRRPDHLSLPRRPLLRADAQHRARRRHLPQDHQRRRPQEAQGDLRLDHRAPGRRPDRPHRRRATAPRPRSSATTNTCCASGKRSATKR